ncbi:MAG: prepilin-type N-terminal cleavage/methylation domain-containing protein [Planctomycetaceae bacterium]|nr:prepilin-type N-terminal cleavage/methylation domain-containing protein [Planctomycetaceae bacterium]
MRNGFTLVEISIGLVIIGLVIGGVFVGRDLIEATKVRSVISQRDQFMTAVRTFQIKYGCLPGDCTNVARFGWTQPGVDNGCSPGNGLIESSNGVINSSDAVPGYETTHFWRQLSLAGLISETIQNPPTNTLASMGAPISGDTINRYFPSITDNKRVYWNAVSRTSTSEGKNYFALLGFQSVSQVFGGSGDYDTFAPFTPHFVRSIDQKTDDGTPGSGKVIGTQRQSYLIAHPASNNATDTGCRISATVYSTHSNRTCGVRFEW